MKKFKEKILKLGKRKNCFIALLLVALLAFTLINGLKGSNSAKTEVNALQAPAVKNLDLNGIRYTYNTSLSELKNNYGFFNNQYVRRFLMFNSNNESILNVQYFAEENTSGTQSDFDEFVDRKRMLLQENISFTINENIYNELFYGDGNIFDNEIKEPAYRHTFYQYDADASAPNFLEEADKLTINFSNIAKETNSNNFNGSLITTFVYINDDANSAMNNEELYNNSIFYNVALSKAINYTFNIKKIRNYDLKQILICFEDTEKVEENAIYGRVFNEFIEFDPKGMSSEEYITISDVGFINSNEANIITFNSRYEFKTTSQVGNCIYQGNILLSNTKYDNEFISAMRGLGVNTHNLTFDGGAIFGGNFENNHLTNYIKFEHTNLILYNSIGIQVTNDRNNKVFSYPDLPTTINLFGPITYSNQSRLMYLPKINTLRTTYNNVEYAALSAQVEDILYDVQYVGNIEEKEFEEKVQDDFIDLLKTTGLGAAIGLIIGILLGNPIGGLIVGAAIGFFVAIFPLIIDALQSIFGHNFLSGLYNFFNSITEFFVNIIDSIVNFLISIITNPFVLVLIVILVLLYIFVIRPKIK